jgi:oligopeptide transport system substrate-binding protein
MKAKQLIALSAIATALLASSTLAKPYPSGTQLAEKQEIVLNNGAEVTSIDPAKQAAEPAFNLG